MILSTASLETRTYDVISFLGSFGAMLKRITDDGRFKVILSERQFFALCREFPREVSLACAESDQLENVTINSISGQIEIRKEGK
jgi:hypothetical protein